MIPRGALTSKVVAWSVYDWANSAFALSIMAALYPVFLGSYWSIGASGAAVTARLAWITAAANAVVSILAPIFGTIADAGGYRKRFLVVLALFGAAMTASLGLVGEGSWQWAAALYVMASIGFYSSTVFYDSLIIDVTRPRYYSFVSSLGFSMGYLGGASLLAIHVWMLTSPETFGLASSTEAMKVAFMTVGVWWALFLVPLIVFVPEKKSAIIVTSGAIRAAVVELKATIRQVRKFRNVAFFLFAYWLYIGGVYTVIFMATNYGQRLGFSAQDLVKALMVTNFVGFPATLIYGFFGHHFGPKRGIYFALAVYVAVSGFAVFITHVHQFYVMAIIIGCVQGGVQGLSRSLYALLIPQDQPGEFFGFYNMVTKFSHVLGPVLVGIAAMLSDNPQWVLLAVMPLFIIGAVLLSLTRVPAGQTDLADHNEHRDTIQ